MFQRWLFQVRGLIKLPVSNFTVHLSVHPGMVSGFFRYGLRKLLHALLAVPSRICIVFGMVSSLPPIDFSTCINRKGVKRGEKKTYTRSQKFVGVWAALSASQCTTVQVYKQT